MNITGRIEPHLIAIFAMCAVPEIRTSRGKVSVAHEPAHVDVCGPLGGRQTWTADECRTVAWRLLTAASWLDDEEGVNA